MSLKIKFFLKSEVFSHLNRPEEYLLEGMKMGHVHLFDVGPTRFFGERPLPWHNRHDESPNCPENGQNLCRELNYNYLHDEGPNCL